MKRQRDIVPSPPLTAFHHFPDLIEEMKGEVITKMDQMSLFALAQTSQECFKKCRPRVTVPLILETIVEAGDMALFDYIIDCGWAVDAYYIYEMFVAVVKRANFPLVQKFEFTWTLGLVKYRDLSAVIRNRDHLYKAIGMSGSADVIRYLTHDRSNMAKRNVLSGLVAADHVPILKSLGIFWKKQDDCVARFGECLGMSDSRDNELEVIYDALQYGSLPVLQLAFRNRESTKRAKHALSLFAGPDLICASNYDNPDKVMEFLASRQYIDITDNNWVQTAFANGNYKALAYLHRCLGDSIFDTLDITTESFYVRLCEGFRRDVEFGMLVLEHTFARWGYTSCCCDIFRVFCEENDKENALRFLDFLHSRQVNWGMQHLEKWVDRAESAQLLGMLVSWFIDHGLRDLALDENQWSVAFETMDFSVILKGLQSGIVPKSTVNDLYLQTATYTDALAAWKQLDEHGAMFQRKTDQSLYILALGKSRENILELLDWIYERDKHLDLVDTSRILTTLSPAQLHWLDGKNCNISSPGFILRDILKLRKTCDILNRLPFLSRLLGDVSNLSMQSLLHPGLANSFRKHKRIVALLNGLQQQMKIPLTNSYFLHVMASMRNRDIPFYINYFAERGLPTITPEFACSVIRAKFQKKHWVKVWLQGRNVEELFPAAETLKCLLS